MLGSGLRPARVLGISGAMDAGLNTALDNAWRLLESGADDRRSPVHTPVVASVDEDGGPDARVMVLRAADRASAMLRFHTDARAPKCTALQGRQVRVLAYHPAQALQLRLAGTARVVTAGAEIEAIWAAATAFARRAYLVEAAPGSRLVVAGSGLPAQVEGRKPDEAELAVARANFAVIIVDVTALDWLHLAQDGHRRAQFAASDGWAGAWVVP